MLDRHAVQQLLDAGVKPRAVAQQFRVSRRTIERIAREAAVRMSADGIVRREGEGGRRPGRPRLTDAIRARIQALVLDDPECPPGEICRLLRSEGTPLGLLDVQTAAYRSSLDVFDGCRGGVTRSLVQSDGTPTATG